MPSFVTGTVSSISSSRAGLQRVVVDGRPAYVLTELIGPVAVGDRVVVNTTAVDLGLGTGGWDVVHWNLSRESWEAPGGGHVMKLRYTSLQSDVGAAEDAPDYVPPPGLAGTPVVACGLHSQVALVAAAVRLARPAARIAYVMTDSAALPLALSDLVAALVDGGFLDLTVTAGQAFGGQLEAVNLTSALEVACAAGRADVIVCGAGPGVVGTNTGRGFTALEVAGIVDAAARLGGRPVVAVRYSDADERPRHRGVSHHVTTALAHAHRRALVAVPAGMPEPDAPGHEVVSVEVDGAAAAALADAGIRVTTMGRGPDADPGFFAYATAAGVLAASLLP